MPLAKIPKTRREKLKRKKIRIKKKIFRNINQRLRLCVFRSNKNLFAQIIDDEKQTTLVACSTLDSEIKSKSKNGANCEVSGLVGEKLAKLALQKKIEKVVFDRNGYLFHGRVKSLAEGARKGGLSF